MQNSKKVTRLETILWCIGGFIGVLLFCVALTGGF